MYGRSGIHENVTWFRSEQSTGLGEGGLAQSTVTDAPMPLSRAADNETVAMPGPPWSNEPVMVGTVRSGLSARASGQDITLNWTGNCEPDLIGYVVSRSSGGVAHTVGQVRAGACNDPVSYVDKGAAANGYRYAVQAVRDNGDEDARTAITSDPSVTGPVSPPTTAPAKPAAPAGTAAAGRPGTPGAAGPAAVDPQFARAGHIDLSGFDALRARATVPTPDPGYSAKLPFAAGRPGAPPEPLRELGPAEGGLGGRRGFLLSSAAGVLLFVLALQLRWLAARVAEQEGRGPL